MQRQGKDVTVTEKALNFLTEKGFSTAYGERFLKRHIDEKVKLPITAFWKTRRFHSRCRRRRTVVKPLPAQTSVLINLLFVWKPDLSAHWGLISRASTIVH